VTTRREIESAGDKLITASAHLRLATIHIEQAITHLELATMPSRAKRIAQFKEENRRLKCSVNKSYTPNVRKK